MKTEVGSFTPSSGSFTVELDDSTLVPKGIFFTVSKTGSNVNYSTGYSNVTKHRANWAWSDGSVRDSGRSATKCILHKKTTSGAAATALEATCTAFNTGEFDMNFTVSDNSYTVSFMVVGD